MIPTPSPVVTPRLKCVFRGSAASLPDAVRATAHDTLLVPVAVAPEDHLDFTRLALMDALVIHAMPDNLTPDQTTAWRAAFEQAAIAACPGHPADYTEPFEPPPPLDATPWQINEDHEGYAHKPGHWIVLSGDGTDETDPTPHRTREEAQAVADRLNAEDPHRDPYSYWFTVTF